MIGTQGLVLLIFLVTTGFVKADTDQCMLIFHLILIINIKSNKSRDTFGGTLHKRREKRQIVN